MSNLKSAILKLAHSHPELRKDLLPLVASKQASQMSPLAVSLEKANRGLQPLYDEVYALTHGMKGAELPKEQVYLLRHALEKIQDFKGDLHKLQQDFRRLGLDHKL